MEIRFSKSLCLLRWIIHINEYSDLAQLLNENDVSFTCVGGHAGRSWGNMEPLLLPRALTSLTFTVGLLLKSGHGVLFSGAVLEASTHERGAKKVRPWMENLENVVSWVLGTSATSQSSRGASRFHSDTQCGGLGLAALSWWRSGCVGSFFKSLLDYSDYWAVSPSRGMGSGLLGKHSCVCAGAVGKQGESESGFLSCWKSWTLTVPWLQQGWWAESLNCFSVANIDWHFCVCFWKKHLTKQTKNPPKKTQTKNTPTKTSQFSV